MEEIVSKIKEHRDEAYRQFHKKLVPTKDESFFIGVRTPELRKLAKEIAKESYCDQFLQELPHSYFEENQLHGFILSDIKDFEECMTRLEAFLPYIDNWATCDQTAPKVFKKHHEELLPYIYRWLQSEHPYTIRFAIGMLMTHFLDEDFDTKYLDLVTGIRSDEYYVNMEIAWYMATALAKQWEATVPYIENKTMAKWTHNKTIQKARESYRITQDQKEYLNTLKIK